MTSVQRASLLAAILSAHLSAQPPVAPTNEPVGPVRGQEIGGYNVTNSFELGYRFHSVGGSLARYQSDVNYGNGIRLLGSSLTVHSKEGHGRLFDELVLNTQGLGNDPYEFANFRIQHNRFYRYDLAWRQSDFLNPGLDTGPQHHFLNTRRMWQDHDLTLFPQSAIRFLAGYSRNSQDGAGIATQNLFDQHRGDEFPLFADIHRRQREFRLGVQAQVSSVRVLLMRGWQRYEEDSPLSLNSTTGLNTDDLTTLSNFRRSEPYEGSTPFWRGVITAGGNGIYAVNGAISYAGTRRDFTFEELAVGTSRLGQARNRQVVVAGTGTRPLTTANLTLSLFPAERVTIANHSAFHQIQMNGDNTYSEVNNQTQVFNSLDFRYLGIRTWVNTTDAQLRLTKWVGLRVGYQFSDRRIRSVTKSTFGAFSDEVRAEQTNQVHAGLFGLRLQPVKPLTINLDAELGRADRPFQPVSEKNYHALGGRVQYKKGSLLLSAATRMYYNTNSVSLSSHSAQSRNYALDASWTPNRRFAIDAGYGKQHLDTLTGIAYFTAAPVINSGQSLYISNVHSGHLTARFAVTDRIDFSIGYSRVQDTGDGRSSPGVSSVPTFAAYQTFPLAFESPQGRMSVRLHSRLRWNAGYQYYRYAEDFAALPSIPRGYRAHTGYTSVLWSF